MRSSEPRRRRACDASSLACARATLVVTLIALGAAFENSGVILVALAPLIFLRFMSVPLGDALASLGHTRRLSQAAWLAFGTNLTLNLILIPRYGVIGAAIATCCSQVCMLGVLAIFAREAGLRTEWDRILKHPLLAAAAVAGLLIATPIPAGWMIPVAVVILYGFSRVCPTSEHESLLRSLPRRARAAGESR